MTQNEKIAREMLELFKSKGIVFRDNIGHYTVDSLIDIYNKEAERKEPIHISAKDLEDHIAHCGRSGSNKSNIEEKFTEASKENGMILVIKSANLPSEAMSKVVDLKGQVIIASVIGNNCEETNEYLGKLGIEKEDLDTVVELAIAHLSQKKDK